MQLKKCVKPTTKQQVVILQQSKVISEVAVEKSTATFTDRPHK